MDPLHIVLIILGLSLPIIIFVWHERAQTNPASRWPVLAKMLDFAYSDNPPRLVGRWKERQVTLQAGESGAVMYSILKEGGSFRVEIGPKEAMEKASGMIVPDKVEIPNSDLDAKFLVRATPAAAGEAVDLNVLMELTRFPGGWALVVPGRAELRLPFAPNQASQVRDAADIIVSLADSLEGI
ncbi:MAG: hypothetical protein HY922_04280 [Elusimicrobia bacterium]|nr:hypothetical protein [Elusimicrobiota bacterium]